VTGDAGSIQVGLYIYLYSETPATTLELKEVAAYIIRHLPAARVALRGEFLRHCLASSLPWSDEVLSSLAERMASARVRGLGQQGFMSPLPGEVQYEKRRLSGEASHVFGVMYEGFRVMSLLHTFIPQGERLRSHVHIVLSNQLFGTWDEGDRRYHARAIICGRPSIISTTGIIEAPAKPREYYLLKQQYQSLGMYDAAAAELLPRFRGRFIDYDDPRMTEVVKGYVMQALFHHLTGEAFCDDRACRLYNAHWQEELIYAQLETETELCQRHQAELRLLAESIAS
jgi:hypothetical protein